MGRKSKSTRNLKSQRKRMGQVKGKFRERVEEKKPVKKKRPERSARMINQKKKARRQIDRKKKMTARRNKPTILKKLRGLAMGWKNE